MHRPPASFAPLSRTARPPQRLHAILLLLDPQDEMHSSSSPSPILLPPGGPCTHGSVDSRNQQSLRAICSTPAQEVCRLQVEGAPQLLFDPRCRYLYRTI